MKILVLGKTGKVGRHLARLLPTIGETTAVGRDTMDLTRPDTVRAAVRALRPDVIINAAGYTHVDRAESNKELVRSVNALAPAIVAEEAKRIGALFVHYSSGYVFDGTSGTPYREADAPNPINEYGRSKLEGEQAISEVGGLNLILRVNWIYDGRGHDFLVTMLQKASALDEVRVVDDQVGSPTWAPSIAETTVAILRDIRRAKDTPGLYHLTSLGEVSRYDFTVRLLELIARRRSTLAKPKLVRIKTPDYPLPAARPLYCVLDNTKLLRAFVTPLDTWEDQLRACVQDLHPQRAVMHESQQ